LHEPFSAFVTTSIKALEFCFSSSVNTNSSFTAANAAEAEEAEEEEGKEWLLLLLLLLLLLALLSWLRLFLWLLGLWYKGWCLLLEVRPPPSFLLLLLLLLLVVVVVLVVRVLRTSLDKSFLPSNAWQMI
jgi:hypothetical protein